MSRYCTSYLCLSATLLGAALAGACGGTGSSSGSSGSSNGHSGGSSSSAIPSGTGGEPDFSTDGGPEQGLVIEPENPVLDVTGSPKSLQLTAKQRDGSPASSVLWLLNDVTVGTIDTQGAFLSQGFVAGKA